MVQEQQRQKNTRIKLGIWGTSSAGKTVYMLMLYHYLKRSKRKDKFLVKVDDQETDDFLQTELNLRIYKGEFPTPTTTKDNRTYASTLYIAYCRYEILHTIISFFFR